jgi:hypothetical protein
MEKARAKRRRRKASRRGKAAAPDAATTLTGKVAELAQGTAAQMGAFVKKPMEPFRECSTNRPL